MLKSEACDCLRVVTGLFMAELCKVSRPTAAYGRPSPALQVHCSSQKVHGFVIGFMFDTQILKATGAGLEAPQESPKGTVKPAVLKHLKEALEAIYNAVLDMEFLDIWRYFDSTMSNAKKHQLAALASQHRLQVLEIRPGVHCATEAFRATPVVWGNFLRPAQGCAMLGDDLQQLTVVSLFFGFHRFFSF